MNTLLINGFACGEKQLIMLNYPLVIKIEESHLNDPHIRPFKGTNATFKIQAEGNDLTQLQYSIERQLNALYLRMDLRLMVLCLDHTAQLMQTDCLKGIAWNVSRPQFDINVRKMASVVYTALAGAADPDHDYDTPINDITHNPSESDRILQACIDLKVPVIGVAGAKCSGKDTLILKTINVFHKHDLLNPTMVQNMSEGLAMIITMLTGIGMSDLMDQTKRATMFYYWDCEANSVSLRQLFLDVGDSMRQQNGDSVLALAAVSLYYHVQFSAAANFKPVLCFVSGIRMNNEAQWINRFQESVLIEVVRTNDSIHTQDRHPTEVGVGMKYIDVSIVNRDGYISDLDAYAEEICCTFQYHSLQQLSRNLKLKVEEIVPNLADFGLNYDKTNAPALRQIKAQASPKQYGQPTADKKATPEFNFLKSLGMIKNKSIPNIGKVEQLFKICDAVADMAKDPKRKVGALLVHKKTGSILSTGCNGFPRGINDDLPERKINPLKNNITLHAELNAILNAGIRAGEGKKIILIVSKFPCLSCILAIAQVGIKTIRVTRDTLDDVKNHADERDQFGIIMQIIHESGITLEIADTLQF